LFLLFMYSMYRSSLSTSNPFMYF